MRMLGNLIGNVFNRTARREANMAQKDGEMDILGVHIANLPAKWTLKSMLQSKAGHTMIDVVAPKDQAGRMKGYFQELRHLNTLENKHPEQVAMMKKLLHNKYFGVGDMMLGKAAEKVMSGTFSQTHLGRKYLNASKVDLGVFDDVYNTSLTVSDANKWFQNNKYRLKPNQRNLFGLIRGEAGKTKLADIAGKNKKIKQLMEAIKIAEIEKTQAGKKMLAATKNVRKLAGLGRLVGGGGMVFKAAKVLMKPMTITMVGAAVAAIATGQATQAYNMIGSALGSVALGGVVTVIPMAAVVAVPAVIGASIVGSMIGGPAFEKLGHALGLDRPIKWVSNKLMNAGRAIMGKDPIEMPKGNQELNMAKEGLWKKFKGAVPGLVPGISKLEDAPSHDNQQYMGSLSAHRENQSLSRESAELEPHAALLSQQNSNQNS